MLAKSLFHCFYLTYLDDDYNVGMAILDKAISFRGPGDTVIHPGLDQRLISELSDWDMDH